MSEGSICPPKLPASRAGNRFAATLASLVILASVVFLAWTANHPLGDEGGEQDLPVGMISLDEANELAMLKLQGRFLIGISQLQPREAIRSLDQLQGMAKTARGKGAVAILYSFVDPENGLENGIGFLEEIDSSEGKNLELKTLIKTSLQQGVSQEKREELKTQMGWFSELVRPDVNGENSDFGAEIRSESMKTMTIFGGFITLGFFAWLAGLILLVLFFILRANGTIRTQYDASDTPSLGHLFVESFAVYIGLMALGHLLGHFIHPGISMAAYGVSFLLAVFWPRIRGCSWKQSCGLIGWNRGTGLFREVGAGVLGYLGIIVIASLGLLLTLMLMMIANLIQNGGSPVSGADTSHPIVGMLDSAKSVWGKLSLLFFAAVMAPFLEETMFRGSLFRYMRHHWGFLLSSMIGGIIFAIIHPQGIFALPALTSMGIGFALLREWRDSLVASMTAHALNNGVIVCLLLTVM